MLRLDAAAEQFIPPLSVPFALGAGCVIAALALRAEALAWVATACLAGQVVYLLSSLVLVRAPLSTYASLLYAPPYVIWKVGLFARALVSAHSGRWTRTARPDTFGSGASQPDHNLNCT